MTEKTDGKTSNVKHEGKESAALSDEQLDTVAGGMRVVPSQVKVVLLAPGGDGKRQED